MFFFAVTVGCTDRLTVICMTANNTILTELDRFIAKLLFCFEKKNYYFVYLYAAMAGTLFR